MIKFDLNLLFGIIDIIIFYLLMKKFLFGRIKKVMDERRVLISKELEEAENKNREADEKLEAYENKICDFEEEGRRIVSEAKEKGNAEYDRILAEARADADELKKSAQAELETESKKAKSEAKEEIAALAIQAAEKIIGSSVNEKTDSAIFDEFLNEGRNE